MLTLHPRPELAVLILIECLLDQLREREMIAFSMQHEPITQGPRHLDRGGVRHTREYLSSYPFRSRYRIN
ncbi:hypothetical protein ACFWN7_11325 [Agromyces sp. NPDC058484]|uniref:hypothetical protein n=1 Tax=Agromyces sp. NPDC058484 TaxID=3346524 RepID=UPI0036642F66